MIAAGGVIFSSELTIPSRPYLTPEAGVSFRRADPRLVSSQTLVGRLSVECATSADVDVLEGLFDFRL